MEPRTQYEALSDTDYGSDYDEIFETNGPEPDGQTANDGAIGKLDIHSVSESSGETDYGDDEIFQDDVFVNGIDRRGPGSGSSLSHRLDETQSMVDFDMLRSSPPSSPNGSDSFFLTSATNWEPASTREISTKMKEVESVRQVINTHFNLKARPWQVSVVIDITKHKKDVCAIAGTNAGKCLVYQSIPVVTGGSVLVISPTIALMEDQVCIAPKTLCIYH